jgi:mono/diheme cytochrome c family protein
MRIVLFLFLPLFSLFAEDFISEFEYGQMLYRDPRGVSCVPCHGETGEGKKIVSYRNSKGERVTISGPDIRTSTLEEISDSIKHGKGIMPKYFLTDKEIMTIHAYLEKVNADLNESKNGEQK